MAARTAPLVLRSVDIRPHVELVTPSVRSGLMRRVLVAAVAIMIGLVVVAIPSTARAEPDEEGMNTLLTALAEAQEAYLDAQARLEASVARQQGYTETLETADAKMARVVSLTHMMLPSRCTLRNSVAATVPGDAAHEARCRRAVSRSSSWINSNTDCPASSAGVQPRCRAPNLLTESTVPEGSTVKYIDGLSS